MEQMKVVVIGGGIGGLATAAFLQRQGVITHVYEQTAQFRSVGAGIVLAPNAIRLIRRLGLVNELEGAALKVRTGWEFRRWEDGRVLLAQDMAECERLYGEAAWLLHRADLVEILLGALDPSTVHLNHRCIGIDQTASSVRADFDNGVRVDADVLIGADGIHSDVRRLLIGEVAARDSGLCAWRALIPGERLPAPYLSPTQTLWLGPGRHLVHYPISAGRTVNVVAFTPVTKGEAVESWTAQGDPDQFRSEFPGWDDMVGVLLDEVTHVGRWSVLDRAPIDTYSFDRIALLGDAAHPMLPFFAQGAGQAIEDAGALASCLTEAGEVSVALAAYTRVRVPRTARVQQASYGRATVNHLPDGVRQRARDRDLRNSDPLSRDDWLYGYDAQSEALRVLHAGSTTAGDWPR
jgi:salicylate hydroxylase